jgi:hypothetical protein
MGFFDSDVTYGDAYNLPTDYKSGLKDILGEAKKLYESKKETGYQDYPGERLAGFTPEELAAMSGISGLVGAGAKYFDPATDLAKGLGERFTADTAQSYMNPYQQSVVDVEKRKAREDFGQTMQDIGTKAVGAGGFGGSRQAILEGEATSDLGQRLGDIQAIGTKQAFDDARKAFEAQKGRERLSGSALAALGQQAPQQALKELTALAGVGESGRGMEQSKMDMAYQNFLDRQNFAGNALGDYASMVYGFPTTGFQKQTQGFSKPSSFQNLMGVIGAGKSLFPSFGFSEGGHIAFRSKGGLSGMYYPEELDQYAPVPEEKATPPAIDKNNLNNKLLEMMNLGSMSSDLVQLQKLRTQIAEAKAKKEAEKDTFMGRLGEFAQGVAAGYDPTRPQTMAGSLAAGAGAVQERNPEMVKAQAEAEALEGSLKTKQAMAELSKDYIKAIKDLSSDIESKDFNAIKDAVYNSFGYTIGPDKKLRGFGGKALKAEDQLIVDKALADSLVEFKSGGYTAVTEFLSKPKKTSTLDGGGDTIVRNKNIEKKMETAKGGQ